MAHLPKILIYRCMFYDFLHLKLFKYVILSPCNCTFCVFLINLVINLVIILALFYSPSQVTMPKIEFFIESLRKLIVNVLYIYKEFNLTFIFASKLIMFLISFFPISKSNILYHHIYQEFYSLKMRL